MKMIQVKILSYRSPQRYAVRRTVLHAFQKIKEKYPDVEIEVLEIGEVSEILKITQVLILPCLVIDDLLVCNGRFPNMKEVIAWFEEAILEKRSEVANGKEGIHAKAER